MSTGQGLIVENSLGSLVLNPGGGVALNLCLVLSLTGAEWLTCSSCPTRLNSCLSAWNFPKLSGFIVLPELCEGE